MRIQQLTFGLLALAIAGCSNVPPGDQMASQPVVQPVVAQPLGFTQNSIVQPNTVQPDVTQPVSAISFPNSDRGYAVDCTQARDYCQAVAGQACPSGFNIVTADFMTTSGLHPRSMKVKCLSNWF